MGYLLRTVCGYFRGYFIMVMCECGVQIAFGWSWLWCFLEQSMCVWDHIKNVYGLHSLFYEEQVCIKKDR